jgi:hypothetical protein
VNVVLKKRRPLEKLKTKATKYASGKQNQEKASLSLSLGCLLYL